MWKKGEITATDYAKLVGVSRPTLYKYIEVRQNEKSN
jgi:predicted DNA-binding transcriptional regulator AlpA